MIILHFDLQPQFKYMNYFIYTSHKQNLQDFIDGLDSFLVRISKENKADWNLDLMNHHKHDKTSEFLDIMFSRAFFPLDLATD